MREIKKKIPQKGQRESQKQREGGKEKKDMGKGTERKRKMLRKRGVNLGKIQ